MNLDHLSNYCAENQILFNIMFVLLSSCNQNCIHCYIPEHCNNGLSTQKIKDTIKEARNLGALNVTFTGGEPFLRKDFFELIEYARSIHMRVFIMSNGSLFTEQDIKKLIDLNISNFSTTIFSMNASIHDGITRVKNSLQKTLHTIELLGKGGINITIKTPLMEMNKHEYIEVEKFAQQHHYHYMTTATIFGKTDGNQFPHSLEIKSELPEIIKDVDRINHINFEHDTCINKNKKYPCSAGFNNICINYDGTVWPCNTLTMKVGNINTTSLTEIWKHSQALNNWREMGKQKIEICEKCNLKNRCTRCPGLAYMEDNNLYGCSSSAKKIAENRI